MTKINSDAAQCAAHLRRTVSQLSRRLRPSLQHDGISVAKLSVIGQLYRAGPMTPTELATREGVKIQTLTRLLAELEADGWLVRSAHASDRRQSLLSVTRLGARRVTAAVQAGEASLAKVIETALSAPQRALLLQACALLDSIGEALSGKAEASPLTAETASTLLGVQRP